MKTIKLIIINLILLVILLEIILRLLGFRYVPNHNSSDVDNILLEFSSNKKKFLLDDYIYYYFDQDNGYIYDTLNTIPYKYKFNKNGSRYSGFIYNNNLFDINLYGCSYTFGVGLNDTSIFSYYLNKRINKYNVNNFGLRGFGIVDIYNSILKTINTSTKIIVINYANFHTDRIPNSRYWQKTRCSFLNDKTIDIFEKYALMKSYIIDKNKLKDTIILFKPYNVSTLQKKLSIINFIDDFYINKLERLVDNKLFLTFLILEKIKKLCDEMDVTLIVTDINGSIQTKKDFEYFKDLNLNILYLNIDNNDNKYNLLPLDHHPNAIANKCFADKLYEYIKVNNFILD